MTDVEEVQSHIGISAGPYSVAVHAAVYRQALFQYPGPSYRLESLLPSGRSQCTVVKIHEASFLFYRGSNGSWQGTGSGTRKRQRAGRTMIYRRLTFEMEIQTTCNENGLYSHFLSSYLALHVARKSESDVHNRILACFWRKAGKFFAHHMRVYKIYI
jgi:hypothetical protein